ncbi:peptide MFS transporter [Microbulbifer agarilyticus]|uniref:peptide MFS transporter n=1 Tax=Microbulbifer agarilyticus TaxID=260552 RepID=UPI001CD4D2B9|nr:peptide MFS transporter [Microbulbifer agarilyticus]MCA0899323.1 peptide MFS transporter [Microbulbifer agarilyticus]
MQDLKPRPPASAGEMMGHPKGLYLLFGTEMWERLSYYGMRGIFVFYLTSATTAAVFGWEALSQSELQSKALSYLGWYAMLVYLTPIIGGWMADNIWGQRRCIMFGGVLMMLGQFALGFPHSWLPDGTEIYMLWLGLALMIVGNGFFKPNISTMVGDLYEEGDKRRDTAFTIFYMGINLGSILGYLVIGWIGEKVDYQLAFFCAGLGMLLGLILQATQSDKLLGEIGNQPSAKLGLKPNLDDEEKKRPLTPEERDRIKVILILGLFTVIFWAGFEQAAGSMNLFAKYNTDLHIFGFEIPASWLQMVNPLFIIILAPVVASIWVGLGSREPSSPAKFSLGLIFLGLGFISMVGAALQIGDSETAKASPWWLVVAYICHTIGELCLSPIGLSMVTKLSPLRYLSLMMGLWFAFIGIANKGAAEIGKLVGETGPLATFGGVAIAAITAGIILFFIREKLVDWMHGAEEEHTKVNETTKEEIGITADHDVAPQKKFGE